MKLETLKIKDMKHKTPLYLLQFKKKFKKYMDKKLDKKSQVWYNRYMNG